MTNTNKSTAPMPLAELKAWEEETCELSTNAITDQRL